MPYFKPDEPNPTRPQLSVEIATRGKDITRHWIGELDYPSDKLLQKHGFNWEIYEKLLNDDQIFSCFQQRRLALLSREWEVIPGGEKRVDQKAADYFREVLDHIGWDDVTDKMLYARFYGYAVAELILDSDGNTIYPDKIKVKRQKRFRFDMERKLRLLTPDNWYPGEPIEEQYPNKFWVFSCGGQDDDDPYGGALANPLYWCTWFKRNGAKFWAVFLEKFGQPTPVGKYPAGATTEEKAKLLAALDAVQTDAGIIYPDSMLVELLEASRSGTVDYESFIAYWDRAVAKILLGQTMTSEAVGGQYKAEVQFDVRQDLVKADADLVNGSANISWVRWLTQLNYPEAATPKLWRRIEDEPDLKPQAERDSIIVGWGVQPKPEYIRETYGDNWVLPESEAGQQPVTLSGVQIQSLIEILSKATQESWSRNKLGAVLAIAFPTLPPDTVEQVLAEQEKALAPAPSPQAGGIQPPAQTQATIDDVAALFAEGTVEFAGTAQAKKKNCKKGVSCGGSCISAKKTCRKPLAPDMQEKAKQAAAAGGGEAVRKEEPKSGIYQGALEEIEDDFDLETGDTFNAATIRLTPQDLEDEFNGAAGEYYAVSFTVNGEYDTGSIGDGREGVKAALQIRRRFAEQFAKLPEGTILENSPWDLDGQGSKRARIYEKFGFGPLEKADDDLFTEGQQWAVIRNGKATPITSKELNQLVKKQG